MISLRDRDARLSELMDDPDCDDATLHRTYAAFRFVNSVVTGWHRSYARWIRPRLSPTTLTRLLDVGCGGGDLALALARWAEHDGLRLDITGVDPDPRAIHVARAAAESAHTVRFTQQRAGELEPGSFDVVVSNHVLHHISDLGGFLAETAAVCAPTGLVLHSDLRRSRVAYTTFSAAMLPLFRDTFIRHDGLVSIRRSYTAAELRTAAPVGWRVVRQEPCRLLLVRQGSATPGVHAPGTSAPGIHTSSAHASSTRATRHGAPGRSADA
jgi:2-polyprenyl-3-methyl-5-hydroxy-6-metoxy-1,4-benzoquinol methylase